MLKRLVVIVAVALGTSVALVASAQSTAQRMSYRWEVGGDADVDGAAPARFTSVDRVGKVGRDGETTYRELMPNVYQIQFALPAFDFDRDNHNTINHPFYLTIRFKDVSAAPVKVHAGKGGAGWYSHGHVGYFGGVADGQWKQETIVIRRSMMRSLDGKTFSFALTGMKDAIPIDWIELFSAAATDLPDRDQRIKAAHEQETARRQQAYERLKPQFKDLGLPPAGEAPPLTDEEQSTGLRVFFPPIQRALYANSQPTPDELSQPLVLCSTPGQTQTVVVAVRALKDLGAVTVRMGDLKGPADLPTSGSVVRWAQYSPQRIGSSWGKEYRIIPDHLAPVEKQSVTPDELGIATITLRVPADAKPGDYAGQITVAADGGTARQIPVQLTVWPFELERPPHSTHGMFTYSSLASLSPVELADMRDHGMDMGVFSVAWRETPQGLVVEERMREGFELLRQMGYRKPIIVDVGLLSRFFRQETPENQQYVIDFIRRTKQMAEEAGFTDSGYFPVDEPHTDDKIALSKTACAWIKQAGALSYITSNPRAVPILDPVLDYVCYNLTYISQETVDGVAKSGDTLMFYCPGFSPNPEDLRYRAGFYLFRSGAQSVQFFAYMELIEDPFLDFDGPNRDWNCVFPSMDSVTHDPSVSWESMREGVNDYLYAHTLRAHIERARQAGREQQAAEAQKVLDQVLAAVDLNGKRAAGPAGAIEANVALKDQQIDPEKLKMDPLQRARWYDDSRKKIAEAILTLRNAER